MHTVGVPWGAREVDAVAAAGNATQLFPVGCGVGVDTTSWPSANGRVRRPTAGRLVKMDVTGNGSDSGLIELWDVGGLDRSAANNVNNQAFLTDAYLTANGVLLSTLNVPGTGQEVFTLGFGAGIVFNRGLAVRFINVGPQGECTVSPFVEGGFQVQEVHS